MKDPAALVYIDKWSAATKGMRGAEKGWYFDLILHQFDKGYVPNDMDQLCSICSVRPSEYDLFKQVFEQVLITKFKDDGTGRLINEFAQGIIQGRKMFLDKRSNAGKISYIMKFARRKLAISKEQEEFLKSNIDLDIDLKNEQVLEHMLKQKLELYINVDVNEDIIHGKEGVGEKPKREPKNKIPDYEEFLHYAIEKEPLIDQGTLKLKYDAWIQNGWKNGNDKKIVNWKSTLLNTIPYIKKNTSAIQPLGTTTSQKGMKWDADGNLIQ